MTALAAAAFALVSHGLTAACAAGAGFALAHRREIAAFLVWLVKTAVEDAARGASGDSKVIDEPPARP